MSLININVMGELKGGGKNYYQYKLVFKTLFFIQLILFHLFLNQA